MKTRLFAILVVAFTLCVVNMEGAVIPPTQLPDQLNIENRQCLIDYAVTNRKCTFSITLYFTNTSGQYVWYQRASPTDGIKFESSAAYKDCIVTNGMDLFNKNKHLIRPDSTLKVLVWLFYSALNATGLASDTNLGPSSLVSSNTFLAIEPTYIYYVLPITNLQYLGIESDIGNGQSYKYFWTPDTGGIVSSPSPSPYPVEVTKANLIVLREWYLANNKRLRLTISNGLKTNAYTQCGQQITSKSIYLNNGFVIVNAPKGADLALQVCTDSLTWSTVTNVLSSPTNLSIPIVINKKATRVLFRTVMW